MSSSIPDTTTHTGKRAAIARLLVAYPNIDESECEEIIAFIKREASALDMALLGSDDATRQPLGQFRSDFAKRLEAIIPAWLIISNILIFVTLLCVFAWDVAR